MKNAKTLRKASRTKLALRGCSVKDGLEAAKSTAN